jgi:phosphoglycolate phosphatase-like HAD superfamily hydrolase
VEALLFDLDGTLADTGGAGKAALGPAMLEVYGETGPIESFNFHGKTDPEIVRGLLTAAGQSDADVDSGLNDLWPVYLRRLASELDVLADKAAPLGGVLELLDTLGADDRFACGLVTGNLEEGAQLKLAAVGCADRFSFGGYGSDSEERDALPPVALARAAEQFQRRFDPSAAVVIGDTPADIRCARATGARVLAVATGRHSEAELASYQPDAVMADLTDPGRVLEFLIDG